MAVVWKKLAYEADVVTKALFAAKGDLLGASADDTPGILSVGTNEHVLTADSAQGLGIKWAAPTGGVSDSIVKGWIQFNGSGTIAIQDSFNVSSIADEGVGKWQVNWDTDFANDDYGMGVTSTRQFMQIRSLTAASVDVSTRDETNSLQDAVLVCVIAIGDQ